MARNKGVQLLLFVSEELSEAIKGHVEMTGEAASIMIRRLVANEIGRPDLGISTPTGRPRKDAAPDPGPVKKVATAGGKKVTARKKAARKGSE